MAEVDYGYGEDLDYGYGEPDLVVEQAPPSFDDENNGGANHTTNMEESGLANAVRRGPKRRCSVTKFSLEGDDAATPLTAASVIDAMRNGTYPTSADATTTMSSSGGDDRRMVTPQNSSDLITVDSEDVGTEVMEDRGTTVEAAKGKKGGVLRILSMRRQK